jgi:hypothetical protein
MTATSVKNKLYQTAVSWGPATQYGAGKLNALAAVSNVAVSVSGLTTIKREGGYTWTASATGGNGSYTYAWERSEAGGPYYPVGSGTSYSEYFDSNSPIHIDLRVTATSGAETGQVVKRVNNLIVP